jgi:hypothetical protein
MSSRKKISILNTLCRAIILIILLTGGALAQGQKVARKYSVPQDGSLQLLVPASWRDQLVTLPQTQNIPHVAILFKPVAGDDFEVLVTAFAAPPGGASGAEQMRQQFTAMMMNKVQGMAAEKQLHPQRLAGPGVSGTYVSFTDKRLPEGKRQPGDYRYVTQGEMVVNNMVVTFTIFCHDRQAAARQEALEMLQNAKKVER